MSIQYDIDKDLLDEVFSKKKLGSKKELRKKFCFDSSGNKNKTKYNSFDISYNNLEVLKIIKKEKLSKKYENVYEIDDKNGLVTILLPNILYFRRKYLSAMEEKKAMSIRAFNSSTYKRQVNDIKSDIQELLNRFIINCKKMPNKKYDYQFDIFREQQSFREFAFKDLLFHFLHNSNNKQNSFLIEDIREEVKRKFFYELIDFDDLYKDVINAFILLEIIVKVDRISYHLKDLEDPFWKMDSRVKSESIHTLIGGITDLDDNPPSQDIIDSVHMIFNFTDNLLLNKKEVVGLP